MNSSMPLCLYIMFLNLQVDRRRERSSDVAGTFLQFLTQSTLFPPSHRVQRDPCLLLVPSATGKSRLGELGRGGNRTPNYKVTRENQSLLELSWYWRHRAHQTADQWVSQGTRRKGEGTRSGYCTKESVPRCVQIIPKVVRDPVTCSDVLGWTFTCLFWLYAHATPIKDLAL